jgi:multisubunit Na+/H+ antiporter MnhG subunit
MTYNLWKNKGFYERNKWGVISASFGAILIVLAFLLGALFSYSGMLFQGDMGGLGAVLAFLAAQVVALIVSAIGPLIDFVRRK